MSAPRLNRRLTLEIRQRLPDGGGGYEEVWVPLGDIWADVQPRTGRERAEVGVPVSAVAYRIVVRATPHGSASRPMAHQRFREGERIFPILAVADCGSDGRFLTCFAQEEVVS
ncbi:MAG: phage tail protein [Pseudooceanicola sp.]|mgnify:CR=1 FL=1|nr:phage tail protein [Pseudooceanicola sp.]